MFCRNCGTEIQGGRKVCSKCGEIVDVEGKEVQPIVQQQKVKLKKPIFKRGRFWIIIVVIIGLFILFGGEGGVKVAEFGKPITVGDVAYLSFNEGGFYEGKVYPLNAADEGHGIKYDSGGIMFGLYGVIENLSLQRYDVNKICDVKVTIDDKYESDAYIWLENEEQTEFPGLDLGDEISIEPDAFLNPKDKYHCVLIGQVGNGVYKDAKEAVIEFKILKDIQNPEEYITYKMPLKVSMDSDEELSQNMKSQEEEDLSKVDLEDFVGKPGDRLKEIGFAYNEKSIDYEALNGKVHVSCDEDSNVAMVIIDDASGKEPTLHGAKIGMTESEVSEKLKSTYPVMEKSNEGIVFVNTTTGASITCKMNDSVVTSLLYMFFSKSELQGIGDTQSNAERYIFQDSDKKYISEDELRGLGADMLMLGRNEIFARHGRMFNAPDIAAYFAEQVWYEGTISEDEFDSDAVFNDFEKKNVELIQRIEDEVKGTDSQESKRQAAIDEALNFVAGKQFHLVDSQCVVEFTTSGEFVAIGYYGSDPLSNKNCNYLFSAEYELHKDTWQYLVYVNIEDVEYYFRCFTDGKINLAGDGEFAGWYEPL